MSTRGRRDSRIALKSLVSQCCKTQGALGASGHVRLSRSEYSRSHRLEFPATNYVRGIFDIVLIVRLVRQCTFLAF